MQFACTMTSFTCNFVIIQFVATYGKHCKACQSTSEPIFVVVFFSRKVFSRGKLVTHGRKLHMVDYNKTTTFTNDKMKSMFTSRGFLEFNVTHEMVPSCRILLFYVREDKETVAATMQFNTEATLENEVCALN